MHTGASYRRFRVITGPSHLGVYEPCGFIRCVIEKAKKTARLGSESSAFDGRVLLGLDRLGLNPVSQRHVTSGSRAGVWLIGCDPTNETARHCSECGGHGAGPLLVAAPFVFSQVDVSCFVTDFFGCGGW